MDNYVFILAILITNLITFGMVREHWVRKIAGKFIDIDKRCARAMIKGYESCSLTPADKHEETLMLMKHRFTREFGVEP